MLLRTFIYTFAVTFCQGNINTVREMSGKCQGILMTPVSMNPAVSVCLFVCLSVCLLTFRVRPVASTVQDGFFPYLVQMI